MGHAAIDLFLKNQGDGDLGETVTTTEGMRLHRSRTSPRPVTCDTIFGEHSFRVFVYSQGPNRKIELRPIDARLNLPDGKASLSAGGVLADCSASKRRSAWAPAQFEACSDRRCR